MNRISTGTVCYLLRKNKAEPNYLQNIDTKEVETERKRQQIVSTTMSMLQNDLVVERASDVKAKLV